MAKKKKGNVAGFVLVAVILVALVLVVVGMFVGQVNMTSSSNLLGKSETTVFKLFDGDVWGVKEIAGKTVGVSNAFGIVAFIVALAGLAVLLIDGIIHYILGKDLKIIRFIGIAATLVGAVLVLVAGLVMASQCGENLSLDLGDLAKNTFAAGAGVWLGFIGGLVGGVAGVMGLLKPFNK